MKQLTKLLKNITTFIFDVDGVLTDGSVMMLQSGDVVRRMNIKDGYALQYAVKKGYKTAIITGGRSEAVKKRFTNLGIKDIYLGVENKIDAYNEYITSNSISPDNVLYMGDDMPDYEIMQKVGFPTCPSDAAEEIRAISKYISNIKGGEGCVRDIVEKTLKAQGKWFDIKDFGW
ncbi:MAG: HAD-IIIA family hydrolase [Bacteroidota bacterium]